MDALYFLKFWRPTTTTTTSTCQENQPTSENSTKCFVVNSDDEVDEGEDSFFELELTVPDDDTTKSTRNSISNPPDKDSYKFDYNKQVLHIFSNKADIADHNFQPTTLTLPLNDLSKRKILPIEPISKRHSPSTSLLKSAPRFRVLMFKKSKSMASHKPKKTEEVNVDTSKINKKQEKKYFTVKLKLEEAVNIPLFTRDNSLRRKISEDPLSDDSSKKFSMEVLHKYLKLIKPLYVKVMRKQQNGKGRLSGDLTSIASPISSPASLNASSPKKDKQGSIPSGIRVACKHLGKSKSASAANGVLQPRVSRRDDSLLLQHDGIQSAILHCKNSFHSSREDSLLSGFSSDLFIEKSVNSSPRTSSEGNGIN